MNIGKKGLNPQIMIFLIIFALVAVISLNVIKENSKEVLVNSTSDSNITEETLYLDSSSILNHNTATDCWTIIDGNVYDITSYLKLHPGGEQTIRKACGINSTIIFNNKDGANKNGHSSTARNILNQYFKGKIGEPIIPVMINSSNNNLLTLPLPIQNAIKNYTNNSINTYILVFDYQGKSYILKFKNGIVTIIIGNENDALTSVNPPISSSCINLTEYKKHNKASSCWLLISDVVYDVTDYLDIHPGGKQIIVDHCGTESTDAFSTKGGTGGVHSSSAKQILKDYKKGNYCTTDKLPPAVDTTPTDTTQTTPQVTASLVSPTQDTVFSLGTTSVTFNITTNVDASCKYSIDTDTSYSSMSNSMIALSTTSHSATITGLTNGDSKTIYVRCQNSSSNVMSSSTQVRFSVTSPTPITLTINSPSANQQFPSTTTSISLSVTSNINAVCAWSYSDIDYSSMTVIQSTPTTSHTTNIGGLTNGTTRTVYIRCSDIYGNIMPSSNSVTFTIVNPTDVQPVVNISATVASPSASQVFSAGTTSVPVSVTTNVVGVCKYGSTDNTYSNLPSTLTTSTGLSHTGSLTVTDGTSYTIYVRCQNSSTNVMTTSASRSFSVASPTPITATITSPTASQVFSAGTTSVPVSVTTNIGGNCRYATADTTYASMTAMTDTTSLSHTVTITGLTDGASRTVYVRCQNSSTNVMTTSASRAFSVASAGQITLNMVEIAKHNTNTNCFLLVNSTTTTDVLYGKRVYSVPSNYINNIHPGGTVINSRCGTDATRYFLSSAGGHTHSSSSSHNMLNSFYIGDLGSTIIWP